MKALNFKRVEAEKLTVITYLKSLLGRSFLEDHIHFEGRDGYQHI